MKFVPIERDMTRLLKQGGFTSFDPYRFDNAMVQKVMNLLRTSTNPTTDAVVETLIKQSIAAPTVSKMSGVRWPVAAAAVVAAAVIAGLFLLR